MAEACNWVSGKKHILELMVLALLLTIEPHGKRSRKKWRATDNTHELGDLQGRKQKEVDAQAEKEKRRSRARNRRMKTPMTS
jgi:hypothetical protein